MSTLTVQLPESLKRTIEALAAKERYSVSQFLASAAGEKLAVVLTMDYLRREAEAGRREDAARMHPVPPPDPITSPSGATWRHDSILSVANARHAL